MPISSVDFVFSILHRLGMVVMWLTFFVFHLTLFVAAVVVLWWLRIPPEALVERLAEFAQSQHAAIAGLLGLSAATILALWVKLWRRVYARIVIPYLFRDLDEAVRREL